MDGYLIRLHALELSADGLCCSTLCSATTAGEAGSSCRQVPCEADSVPWAGWHSGTWRGPNPSGYPQSAPWHHQGLPACHHPGTPMHITNSLSCHHELARKTALSSILTQKETTSHSLAATTACISELSQLPLIANIRLIFAALNQAAHFKAVFNLC